jgi:hypothetical protein
MNMHLDFEEIEVTDETDTVQVTLEWIGEGFSGDYDPDDPDDLPLLRYSVYRRYRDNEEYPEGIFDLDALEDGEWMACNNASYCTQLKVTDDRTMLLEAANRLVAHISQGVIDKARQKRLYEYLSWISIHDGKVIDQHGKEI